MSKISETLKIGNFLKHTKEGELKLLNTRARLIAMFCLVHQQRLLEKELGRKKAMSLIYADGYFLGEQSWSLTVEKLGMNKKMNNIALLKYNLGQSDYVGIGIFNIKKINIANKTAVIHMNSIFAKEYVKVFGHSKYPIDYNLCGLLSAFTKNVFKEGLVCYENKCIGKGDQYCEFIVKAKKDINFKKKDSEIFLPNRCKNFKDLGGNKNPLV